VLKKYGLCGNENTQVVPYFSIYNKGSRAQDCKVDLGKDAMVCVCVRVCVCVCACVCVCVCGYRGVSALLDGYCCTVQGLLDSFEVDLGFPELVLFRFICVSVCLCVCISAYRVSASASASTCGCGGGGGGVIGYVCECVFVYVCVCVCMRVSVCV